MTCKNHRLASVGLLVWVSAVGCLPQDTRPTPARIDTLFALGSDAYDAEAEGLRFETVDGYAVQLDELLLSFGQIQLYGDGCNSYGNDDQIYSRIVNGLRAEPQPLSREYALGQCEVQFRLYPAEDWASVENPGVSSRDRDELRAAEVPDNADAEGLKETDIFLGPRGPRGATMRMSGSAQSLAAPGETIEFQFDFGVPSYHPLCAPEGQDTFEFSSGETESVTIEFYPEALFGTCDSDELRFGAIARALGEMAVDPPLTLRALENAALPNTEPSEVDFYRCQREDSAADDEETQEPRPAPETLQAWLQERVRFDLFRVRDAECRWQPPVILDDI